MSSALATLPANPNILIQLELQQGANWCWAAIASCLGRFYGTSHLSQSEIAALVLDPRGDSDSPAFLNEALACAGCFSHWSPGRPTLERIIQELAEGRPLCTCIEWKNGGAHYVLITGAFLDSRELYVQDPEQGPSIQTFDNFPVRYRQSGWWRGVYWTALDASPLSKP